MDKQTEKQWHGMEHGTAVGELGSDTGSGLTEAEAQARLKAYGPNELSKKRDRVGLCCSSVNSASRSFTYW